MDQAQDDQNPTETFPDIAGLGRALAEANSIVEYLQQHAQELQRRAYLDGYAAGYECAQAEIVSHGLDAHTKSREFVDSAQQHIVSMAVASLEIVASRLGSATMVTAMLTDALEGIKTERQLKISVSRGAAKATREMLARWQGEHPGIDVRVMVDPTLEPFGCEVESELGRLTMGLRKHTEVLREEPGAETLVRVVKPAATAQTAATD